jgi:hypothetical protein
MNLGPVIRLDAKLEARSAPETIEWSYFVDSLRFIHDHSAQLVRRQRPIEAKVISLSAIATSCLLVGVGKCANF